MIREQFQLPMEEHVRNARGKGEFNSWAPQECLMSTNGTRGGHQRDNIKVARINSVLRSTYT
jgi:hypothetical protein